MKTAVIRVLRNSLPLLVLCLIISCNSDDDIEASAEFSYGGPVQGQSTSCSWNGSSDPDIAVPNPKPTFATEGEAGIFTASPDGLVFVDSKTGEIDLAATAPGVYTITNTLTGVDVSATSEFVLLAPETLTVVEIHFVVDDVDRGIHYYGFEETADHPELKDETKYKFMWYQVLSTGEIKDIQDSGNPWESYGATGLLYFVESDPATGFPRTHDALVVDVTNLETGCVTRFAFGKPLSELPEPGRSL